jgi:hypothetical protein
MYPHISKVDFLPIRDPQTFIAISHAIEENVIDLIDQTVNM